MLEKEIGTVYSFFQIRFPDLNRKSKNMKLPTYVFVYKQRTHLPKYTRKSNLYGKLVRGFRQFVVSYCQEDG